MGLPQTSSAPTAEAILGPAPRFRIEGRSLQFGPRNDEVASYRDGSWHSDGRTFAVLESDAPTQITLEGGELPRPEIRGPFRGVQVTEGAVRFGPDGHHVVAILDSVNATWHLCPGGQRIGSIVLAPADLGEGDDDCSFSADDFVKNDVTQSRPDFRSQPRRCAQVGESHSR